MQLEHCRPTATPNKIVDSIRNRMFLDVVIQEEAGQLNTSNAVPTKRSVSTCLAMPSTLQAPQTVLIQNYTSGVVCTQTIPTTSFLHQECYPILATTVFPQLEPTASIFSHTLEIQFVFKGDFYINIRNFTTAMINNNGN